MTTMAQSECPQQSKHLITRSILRVIYIICLLTTIGGCWDLEPDAYVKTAVVGYRCCFVLNLIANSSSAATVLPAPLPPPPSSSSLSSLMTSTTVKVRLNVTVDFGDGSDLVNYIDHSSPALPFQHVYGREGRYVVKVNVTDGHLLKIAKIDVKTRRTADLIRLRLPDTTLFPVSTEIRVQIGIRASSGLKDRKSRFNWDFGDGNAGVLTVLRTNFSAEGVIYRYTHAGTYRLRVTINNALLCEPVIFSAPTLLIAMESADDIFLQRLSSSDAVPLSRQKNGKLETEPVSFAVWTSRGSHLNFTIDFGDDATKLSQPGNANRSAMFAHRYTKEGTYTVCVTVANMLGRRTNCESQMVSVERLPEGLRLNRDHYFGRVGEAIRLEARLLNNNRNVSFDWRLGNDVLLLNAGAVVEKVFSKFGTYRVKVTARNAVTVGKNSPPTASAKVSVKHVLQDVRISVVNTETRVLSTVDEAELVADVNPVPGYRESVVYTWRWGSDQSRSLFNTIKHVFTEPGWYRVTVTADNHVSNVTSFPLELRVIELLADPGFSHPVLTTFLPGEIVSFHAHYLSGSNLTFEWDFADGSLSTVSRQARCNHTYYGVGEFHVTVRISNELSHGIASLIIFIVDDGNCCYKPSARLLGIKDNVQIQRRVVEQDDLGREGGGDWNDEEDDLRMEVVVDSVDCRPGNNHSSLVYTWLLTPNESARAENELQQGPEEEDPGKSRRRESGPPVLFTSDRRWFNVSANQLPIGNHTLHLKIGINGTIVYGVIKIRFTVVAPPFRLAMYGGSRRWFGRRDNVTLTGIVYHYADRKCRNCSFEWKCSLLHDIKGHCFVNETIVSKFNNNEPHTSVLASWLDQEQHQAFIFTLSVVRGNEKISTSQIIYINSEEQNKLRLDVFCKSCLDERLVSKHERIVFTTTCFNCSSKVQVEWEVWLVKDKYENLPISRYDCVQADGSTFFLHKEGARNVSAKMERNDNRKESDPLKNSTLILGPRGKFDEIKLDTKINNPLLNSSNGFTMVRGEPIEDSLNISEGLPGEAGSAFGRQNYLRPPIADSKEIKRAPARKNYQGKVKFVNKADNSLEMVHLLKHETTTDLFQRMLIIKPSLLRAGLNYKIIVHARDQVADVRLEGKAEKMISLTQGPHNGRCTIAPNEGIAYETQFRLSCFEWVGEFANFRPFRYELRYSKTPADVKGSLIRQSFDNRLKFVLPAGLAKENHQVYLTVIVHQRNGGSTIVCSVSKRVVPFAGDYTKLISRIQNELQNQSSNLLNYLKRDDQPSFLQNVHVLIEMADCHGRFNCSQVVFFNGVVLTYLESLVLFTKEEVQLTLSIIKNIFKGNQHKVNKQLTSWAIAVIQRCANVWLHFRSRSSSVFEDIRLFSETIDAVMTFSTVNFDLKMMNLLKTIVSRRLNIFYTTEYPWEITTGALINAAVCRTVVGQTVYLKTKRIAIKLIWERVNQTEKQMDVCVVANLNLNYSKEMVTLRFGLYHRNGSAVNMQNVKLQTPIIINLPKPINNKVQPSGKEFLSPNYMNVYSFQLLALNLFQTLIVKIDFSEDKTNLFPIAFYLSYDEFPGNDNYFYKKTITSNEELVIFIADTLFYRVGIYYIGIVSENYLSRQFKHRNNDSNIEYFLKIEFADCLQMNTKTKHWDNHQNSSILHSKNNHNKIIHCSFDMISDYAISFKTIELNISQVHVDVLLRKPINWLGLSILFFVIITFVLVKFGFYRFNIKSHSHICGVRNAENNSLNDDYGYYVILKTGYASDAGTTSKICIILYGEDGRSEVRRLISGDKWSFVVNPGSANCFMLTTNQNLGFIRKIKIWHDNSGPSPSWLLSYIIINDLQTGFSRYFECNKWLSVNEDNTIELDIYPKAPTFHSFGKIFKNTFLALYYKNLIWSSSWNDSFNNCERFLCCFALSSTSFLLAILLDIWIVYRKHESVFKTTDLQYESIAVSLLMGFVLYGAGFFHSLLFQKTQFLGCQHSITGKFIPKISFDLNKPIKDWNMLQMWAKSKLNDFELNISCSDDEASGSKNSNSTSYHFIGSDGVDFRLDKLLDAGMGQSNPWLMPVWWRYLNRILLSCYISIAVVSTFYLTARFSSTNFMVLFYIITTSLMLGHVFCYPLLISLMAGILSIIRLWRSQYFQPICDLCTCHFVQNNGSNLKQPITSGFIENRLHKEYILRIKTSFLTKRKAVGFIKSLILMTSILILLILAIIKEGDVESRKINDAIQRTFQRKYPANTIENYGTWLQWITIIITDLPQPLKLINENSKTLWYANDFDSVLLGDFLLCHNKFDNHSECIHLPKIKLESEKILNNIFQENSTLAQAEFLVSLFNIPTGYLSVVKWWFEFNSAEAIVVEMSVESVILNFHEKFKFTSILGFFSHMILFCYAVARLKSLVTRLIFNFDISFLHIALLKIIFSCSLLAYLSINYYISSQIYLETLDIDIESVNTENIFKIFDYLKISRSLIGFVVFLHLFHCLEPISMYYQKSTSKTLFLLKYVLKTLRWNLISMIVFFAGFCSLGSLWGEMKSSSFASPLQTMRSLILIATRNFNFQTKCSFDQHYIIAYIIILCCVAYWQTKALNVAVRNYGAKEKHFLISPDSEINISIVFSVIPSAIRRLFKINSEEEVGQEKVSLDSHISLLEKQLEELLYKLDKFEYLTTCEIRNLKPSNEDFEDEGEEFKDSSLFLNSHSSLLNENRWESDDSSRSVNLAINFDSSSKAQTGLRRTKTQGKGIYPTDFEMCDFNSGNKF